MIPIVQERRASQSVHPVLVPKTLQHQFVHIRLEHLMLQLVVLVRVNTELFELFTLDHLQTYGGGLCLLLLGVFVCVGTEATDLNLTSCDRALRIDHDSDGGVLHHLHGLLGVHINTGEPAAVSRVRVVPAADELGSVYFSGLVLMVDHVPIRVLGRIHSGLSSNDGQRVDVHNVHGVTDRVALQGSHHFDFSSGAAVHGHLDESDCRNLDLLKVLWVLFPRLLHVRNTLEQELLQTFLVSFIDLLIFNVVLQFESFKGVLRLIHLCV